MTEFESCGGLRALALSPDHRDYLYLTVPFPAGGARTEAFAVGAGGVTLLVELDIAFDASTACASLEENPPFGARWWRATEGTAQVSWEPGDSGGDGRLGDITVELSLVALESMTAPQEGPLSIPSWIFAAPRYVKDLPA
jgi:hypothetical protein